MSPAFSRAFCILSLGILLTQCNFKERLLISQLGMPEAVITDAAYWALFQHCLTSFKPCLPMVARQAARAFKACLKYMLEVFSCEYASFVCRVNKLLCLPGPVSVRQSWHSPHELLTAIKPRNGPKDMELPRL